jgi:phenylpropionate dioxygenase-like ring-hydroxylating dioxygenase large terminal subunit
MSEQHDAAKARGAADDNHTLPAWVYNDARFFELERGAIFAASWNLGCHVSEIAAPGDYVTRSVSGERTVITRLQDGSIKAFHNTCRHRAHQVVGAERGRCQRVHVCPYHGWTYNPDGSLRGIPGGTERDVVQAGGLPPIETETFAGFVWIRFQPGGPSVAQRLARYKELLSAYRIDEMQSNGDLTVEEHAIDWKNMMDNYLEGYHVPKGHPGLNGMVEDRYDVEADAVAGTNFATQLLRSEPAGGPNEFAYLSIRSTASHLPGDHGRRWSYLTLFPAVNIGLQPESIDYFSIDPIGPGRALFRAESFSLPDARPDVQAARIAAGRVWEQVQAEDNALTASVQQGLEGSSYRHGYLTPYEAGVRAFRDWIRERLPIAREELRPWEGQREPRRQQRAGEDS